MPTEFDWRELLGQAAGVIALLAFVPYITSTLWGTTRPSRVTWWTWSVVQIILTVTFWQSSENHEAIWVSVGYTIGASLISLLSIKYGYSEKMDFVSVAGIVFTILIWYFTGSLGGLVAILLVDAWAALPTIRKSAVDPKSESLWSWTGSLVANTLNLIVITHWHEPAILYPVYLFILTIMVTYLLVVAKTKIRA